MKNAEYGRQRVPAASEAIEKQIVTRSHWTTLSRVPGQHRSGKRAIPQSCEDVGCENALGPPERSCTSGHVWYTPCVTTHAIAIRLRCNGLHEHVMSASPRRRELPNVGLSMILSLTFPLPANPKRFNLTSRGSVSAGRPPARGETYAFPAHGA